MGDVVAGVGYIGGRLVEYLLRQGRSVVGVENGFSTPLPAVRALDRLGDFRLVEGSILSAATLKKAFADPVETVYLLAAQASAHPLAAPAGYTEQVNLVGPRLVLDAAVEAGARTVVYGSSLRVYGPKPTGEWTEATPYGSFGDLAHLSKIYVEKLLDLYSRRHGLRAIAARLAVVYGCGPILKRDERFLTVPHRFCLQAVRGEPLVVWPDGAAPDAFVHLDDAVEALALLAQSGAIAGYRAVNVVGELRSIRDLAMLVAAEAGRRGHPVGVVDHSMSEAPPAEIRSCLKELTGFTPRRRLATTIPELLDAFAAKDLPCVS
ncbi:MAG: NAD(P)-dependent oxidoreductase [Chloroflexi bacterium]|nr:NAD(P)-dependent oxidoreductase [Chloroflexota bacterium]